MALKATAASNHRQDRMIELTKQSYGKTALLHTAFSECCVRIACSAASSMCRPKAKRWIK